MSDLDPIIGALLHRRTPLLAVEPDWANVLQRVDHAPAARPRRIRRLPRRRWLLLAAAIALPAGIAAAHARDVAYRYLSGEAAGKPRREIESINVRFAGADISADVPNARGVVSVTIDGHRYVYYEAPLTSGSGSCFFEYVGGRVDDRECGYDPQDRHPVVSPPDIVGSGTALGAQPFQVGDAPVWVVIGMMPSEHDVASVRIQFEDGTSGWTHTSGAFFSYVVAGVHSRAGHRPIALQGLTDTGTLAVTQRLDPRSFDLGFQRRSLNTRLQITTALTLARLAAQSLPVNEISREDRVSTTPGRIADLFGGRAGAYPPHPIVVGFRGPFAISTYPGDCKATPTVCPAPVGQWAYLAYIIDPGIAPGKPAQIHWLYRAPIGAAWPDLARLGHVYHDTGFRRLGRTPG